MSETFCGDPIDQEFVCVDSKTKILKRVFKSAKGEIWSFDLCDECSKKSCYQDFIIEEVFSK